MIFFSKNVFLTKYYYKLIQTIWNFKIILLLPGRDITLSEGFKTKYVKIINLWNNISDAFAIAVMDIWHSQTFSSILAAKLEWKDRASIHIMLC